MDNGQVRPYNLPSPSRPYNLPSPSRPSNLPSPTLGNGFLGAPPPLATSDDRLDQRGLDDETEAPPPKEPPPPGAPALTPGGTPPQAGGTPAQVRTALPQGLYTCSTASLATGASSKAGEKYLLPDDVDDGRMVYGVDENKERGNWTGKLDFLLSCLGYAVGLGNVWRFPYLCFRNGGAVFFIPYVIMLVFVGIPLFFMELSLGQFCSNGPLTCWGFAPIFKGIGVAQLVVSGMVGIYYNMIIAWSLFYFGASFTDLPSLPWKDCTHDWNTDQCFDRLPNHVCDLSNMTRYDNGTCYAGHDFLGLWNNTVFTNVTGIKRLSPSEEYYNNRVLSLSTGIHDMGPVKWELALCLFAAWVIAFFCMIKGIKSSGKVVYFTALFPYAVLIILLFRGATLPNAGAGIYFYMIPKWERLLDAKVWNDAAVQIFFSLSNCWGGLIALASYNRFHNNALRDTLIVAFGNCGTSVFAGFVIFSFLGFMAGELGTTVENVVSSGPGLAFIVYPDAVTRMPISPLWGILFFLMLVTLGLDSQFAMLETVLTSLMDQFPDLRPHKTKVVLTICVTAYLLGLTMCSHGGAYMLQLMDTYCGGWSILLIGLVECCAVGWVYGADRYFNDIKAMTGKRPALWWRICWQYISPLLITAILLFAWITGTGARYGDYYYPAWANFLGWLMALSSVIWIPIVAIYKICKEDGTFLERIRYLTLPTPEWGPALVKHRRLIDYVPGFVVDPWGTGTRKDLPQQGIENWGMVYGDQQPPKTPASNGVRSPKPQVNMQPGFRTPSMGSLSVATPGSVGSFNNISLSSDRSYHSQRSHISYESGV